MMNMATADQSHAGIGTAPGLDSFLSVESDSVHPDASSQDGWMMKEQRDVLSTTLIRNTLRPVNLLLRNMAGQGSWHMCVEAAEEVLGSLRSGQDSASGYGDA